MRPGRLPSALVVALCAAGLGACGGSETKKPRPVPAIDGATVRTASCNFWRVATADERAALLAQLHAYFGAQVDAADEPGARGPVLDDHRANTLLEGYCRQAFAGAFKLYRIYGRAAAFTPGS